jgi:hypothetical protein
MNGLPAKYFAVGPYRAESLGGKCGWWGVINKNGVNVLTFADKPGAVVTNEVRAKQIADAWNERVEPFVHPVDSYVPPVTQRMTNDEMSAYIRSRRYNFETRRWG